MAGIFRPLKDLEVENTPTDGVVTKPIINFNDFEQAFGRAKGFSVEELEAIAEFKQAFLKQIKDGDSTRYYLDHYEKGPAENILPLNDNPLDPVFLNNLESYVFMEDADLVGTFFDGGWVNKMIEKEVPVVREAFEKLPSRVQSVYYEHNSYNENHVIMAIIDNPVITAEKMLGTHDPDHNHRYTSGGYDNYYFISKETAQTYVRKLEDIKENSGLKTDFNPGYIDQRTEMALDELVKARAKDLSPNLTTEDVENIMIHVRTGGLESSTFWKSLREDDIEKIKALSEAVTLQDLTSSISSGVRLTYHNSAIVNVDGDYRDTVPDKETTASFIRQDHLDLTGFMSEPPEHVPVRANLKTIRDYIEDNKVTVGLGMGDEMIIDTNNIGDYLIRKTHSMVSNDTTNEVGTFLVTPIFESAARDSSSSPQIEQEIIALQDEICSGDIDKYREWLKDQDPDVNCDTFVLKTSNL